MTAPHGVWRVCCRVPGRIGSFGFSNWVCCSVRQGVFAERIGCSAEGGQPEHLHRFLGWVVRQKLESRPWIENNCKSAVIGCLSALRYA